MDEKYALIIVFEYNKHPQAISAPNSLPAMKKDLKLAWDLAVNRFKIPRKNITVITDIKDNDSCPWNPMTCDECNPKIHRLKHPDINIVIREIAQFIENTIRDIPDYTKGDTDNKELFVYISGHGGLVPNGNQGSDNALIFTCKHGINKKYLKDEDIFRLLFGHIPIEQDGSMSVPIVGIEYRISDIGEKYSHFSTQSIKLKITPVIDRSSRGIPFDNNMLMIVDTCNSGDMPKFEYIYDPKQMKMVSIGNSSPYIFPKCICLSATQFDNTVSSSLQGSPFTKHIHNILTENKHPLTIEEIHNSIYKKLPPILISAKPVISSTSNSEKTILPLMTSSSSYKCNNCACKLCNNKINKCKCV
jgi:hypothetical protein